MGNMAHLIRANGEEPFRDEQLFALAEYRAGRIDAERALQHILSMQVAIKECGEYERREADE